MFGFQSSHYDTPNEDINREGESGRLVKIKLFLIINLQFQV